MRAEASRVYIRRLCRRELEIAATIAKGHNCKEIATILGMSEHSVRMRSSLIYEKLDLQKWGDPRSRLVLWYLARQAEGS